MECVWKEIARDDLIASLVLHDRSVRITFEITRSVNLDSLILNDVIDLIRNAARETISTYRFYAFIYYYAGLRSHLSLLPLKAYLLPRSMMINSYTVDRLSM